MIFTFATPTPSGLSKLLHESRETMMQKVFLKTTQRVPRTNLSIRFHVLFQIPLWGSLSTFLRSTSSLSSRIGSNCCANSSFVSQRPIIDCSFTRRKALIFKQCHSLYFKQTCSIELAQSRALAPRSIPFR